ncbi:hypothetical protein [Luteimonas saliphila]|uniref:hypothetical protein n=1 Tax=Luteimonas saliphila TaxID=2804919 RepID=UPI00192DF160|nr:hypothetical protein [Luteimonas saliphila]
MRVDLALFDGDELLDRGELLVGKAAQTSSFALFQATFELRPDAADIVLANFPEHVDLTKVTLDMPIHESADWESVDLGRYTLAFWCRLDA